jgi:hypothetical protein
MNVQVDQTWNNRLPEAWNDYRLEFIRKIDLIGDADDDPPREQDVFPAQLLRRVNGPAGD